MGGPTADLTGRQDELKVVDDLLDLLDGGACPPVLELAGEPGIGKSRLLSELCARASVRGHVTLVGRTAEFERDVPFGVFVAALDDYISSLDPQRLRGLDAEQLDELAAVLPAVARSRTERPITLPAERYKTYRAFRDLLAALATERPLVLALDDVHWADQGSVELLCHLVAHRPRAAVLLAIAYRPPQISETLRRALSNAGRDGGSQFVALRPLTRAEAEVLFRPDLPQGAADDLYALSGGNPFFLEQLCRRAPIASTATDRGPAPSNAIPAPVLAMLGEELLALRPSVRRLLDAAAVVGDPFDVDIAGEVAELPEDALLDDIDELLTHDLIRPTSAPRRFRFRHPIVHQGVYETASVRSRVLAHARAAASLERLGESVLRVAPHVERSAKTGDDKAIGKLVAAAQAAASRAPGSAAHWFGAALRLVPSGAEHDGCRRELLLGEAGALAAVGRFRESHLAVTEALETLPAGLQAPVPLIVACSGLERMLGRQMEARGRLVSNLEALGGLHPAESVALQLELSLTALYAGDYAEMRVWAQRALETSAGLADRAFLANATALVAFAEYYLGNGAVATAVAVEAGTILDGLDDDRLAVHLDAACTLGWVEAFVERHTEAVRHFERGLALARRYGLSQTLHLQMIGLTRALSCAGRQKDARAAAEAAVEASRLTANPQLVAWALSELCLVASRAGDFAGAVRAGQESFELTQSLDDNLLAVSASEFLAYALVGAGQVERGMALLLDATGGPDMVRIGVHCRAVPYEVLTRGALALGSVTEAAEWAGRAEQCTRDGHLRLALAAARRARAAVLLEQGDEVAARDVALEAVSLAEQASAPLEAAHAQVLVARALGRGGHKDDAIRMLEQVLVGYCRCGSEGYAPAVEAELRRFGRRKPRSVSAVEGIDALTERERLIAELISRGKTNRQIATACYLSEKTVERHVSHLLAKLGVGSRTAVAALMAGHSRASQVVGG